MEKIYFCQIENGDIFKKKKKKRQIIIIFRHDQTSNKPK